MRRLVGWSKDGGRKRRKEKRARVRGGMQRRAEGRSDISVGSRGKSIITCTTSLVSGWSIVDVLLTVVC